MLSVAMKMGTRLADVQYGYPFYITYTRVVRKQKGEMAMRVIRILLVCVILAAIIYYVYEVKDFTGNDQDNTAKEHENITRDPESRDLKQPDNRLEGDIYGWMNEDVSDLEDAYGEPVRKDPGRYGYTWWVYNDLDREYTQFGVKDNRVQTIYTTGENASLKPVAIKEKYNDVQKEFAFEKEITFERNGFKYSFHLSDDDLQVQPLIKISDDLFMQFFMDTFTDELVAVRVLTGDILLAMRPYDLKYEGSLPDDKDLSNKEWEAIQAGMERQILDLTNVFRQQFDKEELKWDDALHETALSHSKDMKDKDYFSHVSPNGNGLSERLMDMDIAYQSAGENIAADYVDAPAVVAGWLNSEGHREIMLDDSFTKLGVGVYRDYYTQDYIR